MRGLNLCFLAACSVAGGMPAAQAPVANPWDVMFEQPLVKWALAIGDAKSLPWGDPSTWNALAPGYTIEKAPGDTLALLAPDAPVLARMETMRRAVAYSQENPGVAYQVLVYCVKSSRTGDLN